ncbi:MAG: NRDE family protein [Myxococcales bacterium]|nr:NRDE family protein [Myxococcales bacterium]
MCTIVAIKAAASLVVAANRDEFYARAATAPRRLRHDPVVVAGVDVESGGTWMGANEAGLFVALTNQRQYEGADPARASRGPLVLDALARTEVAAIDALLEATDARDYNGFNLLYGDARELRVAYARHDRAEISVERLDDGVWVLPNDRIGSPEFPKSGRAHALVDPHAREGWSTLRTRLPEALADHDRPPLEALPTPPPGSIFTREMLQAIQSICVHTPVYGTRSATLLELSPGRVEHYLYADGPPCEATFEDVTELFS